MNKKLLLEKITLSIVGISLILTLIQMFFQTTIYIDIKTYKLSMFWLIIAIMLTVPTIYGLFTAVKNLVVTKRRK